MLILLLPAERTQLLLHVIQQGPTQKKGAKLLKIKKTDIQADKQIHRLKDRQKSK